MSLSSLINRSCTIITRSEGTTEDDYGNVLPTVTLVSTVCELQQLQRDEPVAEGEFSDTRWLGIFPALTDLNTGDAVQVDGEEYELEGDPWVVRNPRTGSDSHIEATLCRTAGAGDEVLFDHLLPADDLYPDDDLIPF